MRFDIRNIAAIAALLVPAAMAAQSTTSTTTVETTSSQSTSDPGMSTLGIKAGFSFATLSNKEPDFDRRTGFAAGLAFDMRAGAIGIQPEILYVQKGVRFDGSPSTTAPKLDYIEVPVLFKLTLPTEGLQPFVYAGPFFSFRIKCSSGEITCDDDVIKSTDYGATLGAGLRLGGARGLTVEGRYNWGLQNINDISDGVDSKTRTFFLLLGVSL